MKTLTVLIATLVACTDPAPLPRDIACDEQAMAWCLRAGFDTPGCHVVYMHECTVMATAPTVDVDAQNACLEAIATTDTPSIEPDACRATWR